MKILIWFFNWKLLISNYLEILKQTKKRKIIVISLNEPFSFFFTKDLLIERDIN